MTLAFVSATLAFDGCDMVDGARGSWLLRPRPLVFVFPRFGMAGLHPPSTRLLVLSAVVGALLQLRVDPIILWPDFCKFMLT
jgi:hypothetical protein